MHSIPPRLSNPIYLFWDSIWLCSFTLTQIQFGRAHFIISILFEIQFNRARLISHALNLALFVWPYLCFWDSTWLCLVNLMLIQFGHDCLIQYIFFEILLDHAHLISHGFNSAILVYANLSFLRFSSIMPIQFHADLIPPCLFNPTYLSLIQFDCARLISYGFNSTMLILSYLPFLRFNLSVLV